MCELVDNQKAYLHFLGCGPKVEYINAKNKGE